MGSERRKPVFMLRLQGASGLLLNFLGITELRWFLPRRLIRWHEVQRVVWDEAGARVETTQGVLRLPLAFAGWRELGEAISERIGQDQFDANRAVAIPAAAAEAWLEVGPGGERRGREAGGPLAALAWALLLGPAVLLVTHAHRALVWPFSLILIAALLATTARLAVRLGEQQGWVGQRADAAGLERWIGPWRQQVAWTAVRDVRQRGEQVVVQTTAGQIVLSQPSRQILNALNRAAASNRSGRVQDDVDLSPGAVSLAREAPAVSGAALSRAEASPERLTASLDEPATTQDIAPPAG
ncbi:MAG: hypothetical protein IT204_05505 [Fimbriimonadaceae bacterium]|nr:hypothetical protein [Fimbriimonadaceae bacterium]